jgi:arsenate reductase
MLTIWHNPRCSKSRQTLALIEASGQEVEIRDYRSDAPTEAEIKAVLTALGGLSALEIMRKGDALFKELGLSPQTAEADLIAAMAAHPMLIERPIVIAGDRAVMGRPPENVQTLL